VKKSLAIHLRQAGTIEGFEIAHQVTDSMSCLCERESLHGCSSRCTDSDISMGNDLSSRDECDYGYGCKCKCKCKCRSEQDNMFTKNKLYDSLPSMEWDHCVEKLVQLGHCHGMDIPGEMFRDVFNRRYERETVTEAFECLRISNEVAMYNNNNNNNKDRTPQRAIRARQSQLRRRIFKLQRDSENESECYFTNIME